MIGKLKGIIDSRGEDWVILDVGGVGYEVSCSTRTLAALPAIGELQHFLLRPMCAKMKSGFLVL